MDRWHERCKHQSFRSFSLFLEALERNPTVGPYVVAATNAIEEVKHYCTDQQYFESPPEEKSGEVSPVVSAH